VLKPTDSETVADDPVAVHLTATVPVEAAGVADNGSYSPNATPLALAVQVTAPRAMTLAHVITIALNASSR
jgi:hypothetical protein